MRLGRVYGAERLEAACRRALRINALSYKSVDSILARGLENRPLPETTTAPAITHENLRGAQYYQQPNETKGETVLC
jgi:hypothetical protein